MLKFDLPKEQSSIIKVIGVGGGGSNAVTYMFKQGIKGVDFIICNTDAQVMDTSPVPTKLQIGSTGLGAGNDPSVGREAAMESSDHIRSILERNTKMVFVTAGMGGGTGTGAAPVIASIAKDMDILTVGIVTLPFSFEGRKRKQQADEGISELRKYCDSILIICNDRLRELYGNLPLSAAFSQADSVLSIGAKGIAELITVVGYINVDFEDVKTVMKDSGKAIMGSGTGEGENRAIDAIQTAMASPLLDDYDIRGAANILLYIASGTDEISMDEISDINEYIQNKAGLKADIIWGYRKDESLEKKIAITLIATGFDSIRRSQQEAEAKKVVFNLNEPITKPVTSKDKKPELPLDEIKEIKKIEIFETKESLETKPIAETVDELTINDTSKTIVFTLENIPATNISQEHKSPSAFSPKVEKQETQQEFRTYLKQKEEQKVETIVSEPEPEEDSVAKERRQRLKEMSTKLRNPKVLEELENIPAYERRRVELSENQHSSGSDISRFTLSGDNGELKSDNPFFNPEVD